MFNYLILFQSFKRLRFINNIPFQVEITLFSQTGLDFCNAFIYNRINNNN